MTELHLFDHLFLLLTGVLFPAVSAYRFGETLEYVRAGGEEARVNCYRQVIASWFVFGVALCVLWAVLGRDFAALGVRMPAAGTEIWGTLAAALYLGFVVFSVRGLTRAENPESVLRGQLGGLTDFIPQSRREEHWFYGISVNAGVTEELIFRGFALWYLAHFMGSVWAALVATLLFTFAHIYQGFRLLPGIAITSAVMVGLYVYTESLLLPILLHTAIDAIQGRYFARIRRQHDDPSLPDAVA